MRRALGSRVYHRFLIVLAIGLAVQISISCHSLFKLHQELWESQKTEVRDLVDTAYSVAVLFHKRFEEGRSTEAEAKENAKAVIRSMRYQGDNYFFIWDRSGKGVAHGSNPKFEGLNFLDAEEARRLPYVHDMVKKLVELGETPGGRGSTSYRMTKPGKDLPVDKVAYNRLFVPWGWNIGTGVYAGGIDDVFWQQAWVDIFYVGAMIVLAGAVSLALGRDCSTAISNLARRLDRISKGELDQAVREVSRSDEIGTMAKAVEGLRHSEIRARSLEAERLRQVEMDQAKRIRTETAIQLFRDKISRSVVSLRSASSDMSQNAAAIVAAADRADRSIGEAETRSRIVTQRAVQARAVAENMATSIGSDEERTDQARSMVGLAFDDAESMDATALTLSRTSSEIGDVVRLIQPVAQQLNLLALNATIEAARAGQSGKGFSVVASEVKALAEKAASATEVIAGQILDMQNSSMTAISTVKQVAARLRSLNAFVDEVSASNSVQGTASLEISGHIVEVTDQVEELGHTFSELSTSTGGVHSLISTVKSASEAIEASTENLDQTIDEFLSRVAA